MTHNQSLIRSAVYLTDMDELASRPAENTAVERCQAPASQCFTRIVHVNINLVLKL